MQDFDTGERGSHTESCVWLGLGSRRTLVKVREGLWFQANVNKVNASCLVLQVCVTKTLLRL